MNDTVQGYEDSLMYVASFSADFLTAPEKDEQDNKGQSRGDVDGLQWNFRVRYDCTIKAEKYWPTFPADWIPC